MKLNQIKPAAGSKHARKRVGRGIGSGLGKTAGRGHKGQKARAGGFHKLGFEGGQMPLQRRLPKRGFVSHFAEVSEVRLDSLDSSGIAEVTMASLAAAGLIPPSSDAAKIIATGELKRALAVSGVKVTKGARAAIEAAGGRVEVDADKDGAGLARKSADQ